MTAAPLLVFLPVRNGGTYIAQTIASIVAQSDPNWRLVVLENASRDDTVNIVLGFDDPRISLVPAATPLEMADNWARGGAYLADGVAEETLVTFIGHDDFLHSGFVADIRLLAERAPNATLYQTLFNLVDGDGALIRPCRPVAQVEQWIDIAAAMGWGLRDAYGTGYAFRARDYLAVGGIPALPRLLYADHLLFLRLARLGFKQCSLEVACSYRLHAESTTNSVSAAKINDQLEAFVGFVDTLVAEFPPMLETDVGRIALAVWIERELVSFEGAIVRRLLTPANRTRLVTLRLRQQRLAVDLGSWPTQISRRLTRLARSARLQADYLRAALRAK